MVTNIRRLALSLSCALFTGCATAGGSATTTSSNSKPNPTLISTIEIETTANIKDAYEAVQRLRPNWLTHAQSEGFTLSGTSMAGSAGASSRGGVILVYFDNARLGGLPSLKEIPISNVGTIQFMDPATATALLPGLSSYTIAGAIVVHSRSGH